MVPLFHYGNTNDWRTEVVVCNGGSELLLQYMRGWPTRLELQCLIQYVNEMSE